MKSILLIIAIIIVGVIYYGSVKEKSKHLEVSKNIVNKKEMIVDSLKESKKVVIEDTQKKLVLSKKKNFSEKEEYAFEIDERKLGDTSNIGKDLTVEEIESSDKSQEEKEILIADMIYYNDKHQNNEAALTENEALELIENDVKNGILP